MGKYAGHAVSHCRMRSQSMQGPGGQGAHLLTRLYAATGMACRAQHGSAHSARAGPSSAATCACSACSRRPCASASSYLAACHSYPRG